MVVIDNAAATVMESTLDVEAPAPSESWMVKLEAGAVGVPLITPVALASLRPAGSEPDTAQVRGAVPPDETSVVEYAAPTVALGKELVVIDNAAATVMESTLDVEAPTLSESWMVKLPALAVGVPLITPVALARLSPAGSEPETAQVRGAVPPDEARVVV